MKKIKEIVIENIFFIFTIISVILGSYYSVKDNTKKIEEHNTQIKEIDKKQNELNIDITIIKTKYEENIKEVLYRLNNIDEKLERINHGK